MKTPAITLELLGAGYGDCLLLQCPVGDKTWRMLVDTGPDETFPVLKARLAALPPDGNGKRHIDVFVVTHIDHDHIGGAGLLLSDRTLGLSFGDIWFNAPPRHLTRSVAEGESLAALLGATQAPLPWNAAFGGKPAVTPHDGGFVELPAPRGKPRITLLSPSPDRLTELFKVWDAELERLHKKESSEASPADAASRSQVALDIPALAAKVTPTDHAVPNGSSIAILLEHQGASVLLGADAFPTVLVAALKALAAHRQHAGLAVDAFKLSHHGSRANVTTDLLEAVQARHYLFSTNNAIFNHPDDESVARVLVPGLRPTLWFNYATPRNLRWDDRDLKSKWKYEARYPMPGSNSVVLALAGTR